MAGCEQNTNNILVDFILTVLKRLPTQNSVRVYGTFCKEDQEIDSRAVVAM